MDANIIKQLKTHLPAKTRGEYGAGNNKTLFQEPGTFVGKNLFLMVRPFLRGSSCCRDRKSFRHPLSTKFYQTGQSKSLAAKMKITF